LGGRRLFDRDKVDLKAHTQCRGQFAQKGKGRFAVAALETGNAGLLGAGERRVAELTLALVQEA
jgi:hypothetical protein